MPLSLKLVPLPLVRSLLLGVMLVACHSRKAGKPAATVITESARNRVEPREPAAAAVMSADVSEAPSTGDTLEYTVLIAGRSAGRLRQWSDTGGAIATSYTFNDRGRGPALRQIMRVDRGGLPIAMQLNGTDYLKAPVKEMVAVVGPLVTWRNETAAGRAPVGTGFYLPAETLPTDVAQLARALLQVLRRTVPILPAGVATMTSGEARTVSAGSRTMRVTPHFISGLGLTPEAIWLDASGNLFASGSTWQMVIRRGFESAQSQLVQSQLASSRGRDSVLATRLARKPNAPVAFIHANLFDAASREMKPAQTVIVRGDRIDAAGDDGAVALPTGAEVIDATGKTLLPGLWDMHVHVQDDDGLLHLAGGVTTVRDLANDTDELLARRARFNAGSLLGPRVLLGGFMDGPGPFAGPTKVLIPTREAARLAVENYANLGYEQIKVYSSLDPSFVQMVTRTAHQRGMRVSGHVPHGMTAEQFVRAGADEIQHANFLFLNFFADSNFDTRTPARFTAVARRAASLDLKSERVVRFIALLKERDIVVDPTLNIFEQMFTARAGTLDPGSLPLATRLPPVARRSLLVGGLPATPAQEPVYRNSFINMQRMVKRLHDAGVRIVAGTDASAGFSLHRELELYSEAGIPNTEILYIATLGAARVMKHDAEWGSVTPGKLADLMLVDGDPSQRIRDLRRSELVMKGGVIYLPDSLYAAVGVKPAPRKGVISTREVRAEDVICRGSAVAVKKGSTEPVPLNCVVQDSAVSAARNRGVRRPAVRPGVRPAVRPPAKPAAGTPGPARPAPRRAPTTPAPRSR